jgi:hypothetical protein
VLFSIQSIDQTDNRLLPLSLVLEIQQIRRHHPAAKAQLHSPVVRLLLCIFQQTDSQSYCPRRALSESAGHVF